MSVIMNALKSIFKTITKLSRPYFSFDENLLKFKVDSEEFLIFPIQNIETKTRHDSYVLEAYTISADDIYIEYIHTDHDVSWNGDALSFFTRLLKTNLKVKDMNLLEKKEFNHYQFLVYKIDNEYILNIIHIYEMNKEIFIIDTKSQLYRNLLKKLEKNYEYIYDENPKLSLYLNVSLVRNNTFNNYFRLDSSGE